MGLENFNRKSRVSLFDKLASQEWDILIIGGGITGASIFRDAVMRGMNACLVEGRDFASGTSSASSQLVHGGLRYIKTGDLKTVWESCHERDLLLRLNPALVKPMKFVIPVYDGTSMLSLRFGLFLYELLSGFHTKKHARISKEEMLDIAKVRSHKLVGGLAYWDAWCTDSRLTLETIKDGVHRGGIAINHAMVTSLVKNDGRITCAKITDHLTGHKYKFKANIIVNATGPSVDVVRKMDDPKAKSIVRLSSGVHLVFNADEIPLKETLVFKSHYDGRQMFFIKRPDGKVILGTTDYETKRAPLDPCPDGTAMLGSAYNDLLLIHTGIKQAEQQYVYSGFRPLVRTNGSVGDASRGEHIEISDSGLVTIVGGKLTIARRMAQKLLDKIDYANRWKPCATEKTPLLFGRKAAPNSIEYVCQHEMACTIEDIVERRMEPLRWRKNILHTLPHKRICKSMGIGHKEYDRQKESYKKHFKRYHQPDSWHMDEA
jgi:glycerol-3-phosphate dehydrogenase